MAQKCFMCGREISKGILCDKCDKPRRPKAAEQSPAPEPVAPLPPAAPAAAPPPPPAPSPTSASAPTASHASSAVALDPFPKAPVVTFPIESASLAITSVVNLLMATGTAAVLLGADRNVKFVTDEAKKLFDAPQSDINVKFVEGKTGIRIGELSIPATAGIRLRDRNILYSLVPLSGGASGAVLVFRHADGATAAHASFVTYVRETVTGPLRALRESLLASARMQPNVPMFEDSAATLDQVLSSLELAPGVEESGAPKPIPTVTEVVRRVAERFQAFGDLKGIHLQVDVQDLEERFRDHDQLAEALGIMMDNALHYVPASGQVVLGVRWMEHKNKPLILFFVMDNGPLVPEHLRTEIFEPGFVWNPSSPERTGRSLFRCREFAVAHSGSVWVESKTGKACTFFMRVRPDGIR